MSHIDEGALHAYLDGALDSYPAGEAAQVRAHLDSCEECARRLDEARAIREQAESILAPSAPVVQMPPLEDLRVLAKRRAEASQARGMSRLNRWGWAASVVLALGSGWMLRGSIPGMISRPVPQEQAVEPSVVSPSDIAAPSEDASVGGVQRSEEEVRQQADLGANLEADPSADEMAVDFADADVLADQIEEQPDAQAGARDAPAAAAEGLSVPPPTAPAPTLAQQMAVVVDSLARMREAEELPAADRAERAKVARSAAAPAQVVAAPNPAEEERPSRAFRRFDAVVAERLGLDPARALIVPGLDVIEVARVEEAQVDGTVLVRQRMQNGDTLEILHLPAGSDASAIPPAPTDGRTQLVAANGEGWIVLQANAERDELEQYVRRILGG